VGDCEDGYSNNQVEPQDGHGKEYRNQSSPKRYLRFDDDWADRRNKDGVGARKKRSTGDICYILDDSVGMDDLMR